LLNGIDFWPFLSVELVLLMIFMVSGPSPHANRSPVDLARAQHAAPLPGALREDAMLISVTRDGNIFFGTHQIQCGDLPTAVRDSVRHGSERKVYLKVDARAKYGDAVAVTFGEVPTETVTVAVFEQPLELVPVTEYVVVEVGLIVILAVV